MNVHHDTATPTLSVNDPRALVIRSVGYCRHPDKPAIESRITRQMFDAAGRLVQSWDPRLWGTAPKPNAATIHGLSGQPLLSDSVDAGWQLSLLDQAGSLRSFWDGRGNKRHIDYDDQQRPITVTEQTAGELPRVVERLTYGGAGPVFTEHNQCGRLIRHDNPAGSQRVGDYGLTGSVLMESRRLLTELETPDWPDEVEARDELLEEQSFVTHYAFLPTGEIQRQIDAMGNARTFGYDVAGKLSEVWLQLTGDGKQPQCLVSNIRYNANDQIESETAGNGVETRVEYDAENGRLTRLIAAVGNQKPLQDLNYLYDQIGNIVEMEDKSQSVTHFNNQRIEPINRYRYDSLYQLVEAKGWEVSNPSHGPALPQLLPTPLDPNQRRKYTQQFAYDPAGNLISRHHSGAPVFSMFTSAGSNRSLAQRDDGSLPGEPEITSGFDACGNQLELQRGQAMVWDIRNQLSRVTLVKREGEPDDYECYAYDRPGHRLRKVHFSQTGNRTLRTEVRYLPGLEVHRQADGEEHHVISVEAGRSSVRALHWPEDIHDDQLRYSFSDHLGSSTLELDDEAGVLTQEHYYPYGGTACWAGKNALVAKYKTIRYSGKERDATGLYYYGYRYCAPWLHRWLSADPLGNIDGLNFYCFAGNSPMIFLDPEGTDIFHFSTLVEDGDMTRRKYEKLVVDFEMPKLVPGEHLSYYLRRSLPGNSFVGLIDIVSGEVDIYPLNPMRNNDPDTIQDWQSFYQRLTHDDERPIQHLSTRSGSNEVLTSHQQAVDMFKKEIKDVVGFTFHDVREVEKESSREYRRKPVIVGDSRGMNSKKISLVSYYFESVGTNKADYAKAFEIGAARKEFRSLPIEMVTELLGVFATASGEVSGKKNELGELFNAELQRPELQLPVKKGMEQSKVKTRSKKPSMLRRLFGKS